MGVFLEYKKGSEKFERTKRCNQITLKQLDEDEMNIKIASKYNNSENGESFTNGLVNVVKELVRKDGIFYKMHATHRRVIIGSLV